MSAAFEYRWYQSEGISELSNDINECIDTKSIDFPIGVFPTGSGKTIIMTGIVNEILSHNPKLNILVLAHDKWIISQNYSAMIKEFGNNFIGLYSAGLKSREIKKITVAGIQSIYRRTSEFEKFDVAIVDECHLINPKSAGMYRKLIDCCKLSVVGLTATPFRLGHGYIHKGKGSLFKKISYDITTPKHFKRLIDEGYLSRLITKRTLQEMDVDGIKIRKGDFDEAELSKTFNKDEITSKIVSEIIEFGFNYKHWLVFAIDIEHADQIVAKFISLGISAIAIHSRMEISDQVAIKDYRSGKYRVAVNVNMLTTGFDYPEIDLIAVARPTKSPVFHVQSAGRGLRVCEGKDHCLILDFAGNTERLGPIDSVNIKQKDEDKKGNGAPITKVCPECDVIHHAAVRVCDVCGFKFIFKHNLELSSSSADIFSTGDSPIRWVEINTVLYRQEPANFKRPAVMVVTYKGKFKTFSEYVCIEHPRNSFAERLARNWLKHRLPENCPLPKKVCDLLPHINLLSKPKYIRVDFSKKNPKVLNTRF